MRNSFRVAAVALTIAALIPGSALASENIIKFFERNNDTFVTQGEWAVFLVKAMGKENEVAGENAQIDFIALLEKNRIQPLEGWNSSEFLSYGAKAVTMVQSLGLEDQLAPDAKEADYVWFLESLGFHEGTPAQLVKATEALQRNINDPVFQEVIAFNVTLSSFAPKVSDTARPKK